ncbi:alanine--tRNA ligase, partial [Candidatus Gottesmanbacteria bacterium]|nr:alanine--tRNA ligase [Candidatus Gottesmanbacteria bacterium]
SRSGEPDKMPPGEPGGPDSEVFFDFGKDLKIHEKSQYKDKECHPNCDCGRYLEIANSVFMQYQKQSDGSLKELPNKNVDFGGGLERMVAATIDNPDIFQTDLYSEIIETIEEYSDKKYEVEENKPAIRIIADHLKAATFLIVDGVIPSNKTQGYVLRRLLRRAAVKMHQLNGGLTPIPGFQSICKSVLKIYQDTKYFNFSKDILLIDKIIDEEMGKFSLSLDRGLKEFQKASEHQRPALLAFNLFQTYGFPFEITEELFKQKNKTPDRQEFDHIFKSHQELSRTAAKGMFKGGLQDQSGTITKLHTATHLLQQALRIILGIHVRQKGSNITSERLRFDFSHPAKMTDEEIQKVEELINNKIRENLSVTMEITNLKKALDKGALTVPGVGYPEKVKVYSVGNFSKEVCGGPHVDFTGRLGKFKIIKEEALAANIRRIYAILEQ